MLQAQILAAFKEPSERGYILARRLRIPASKLRREMVKMAALGLVERCPRYSYVNSVSWRLVAKTVPCPAP